MMTMHLQNLGTVPAVAASTIVSGDYLQWNCGYVSRVLGIARETKSFRWWLEVSKDGSTFTRKVRKDRPVCLVVYKGRRWYRSDCYLDDFEYPAAA